MRRLLALLAAGSLVVAACNGTTTESTTTTSTPDRSVTTTTATGAAAPTTTTIPSVPSFPGDDAQIGSDPAVGIGTLDNGLTFYIRENDAPGGRAQLRLVVKAGSVHEEADQHGVAHYLEHMMFNGTEEFPANELVRVLERFGSDFGPDINAYTSYEETVYELELPTDDPEILETGFDVLEQWATAATLDPEEVDLERGVLLEEWRLRDQRFEGRYRLGVTEHLLAGTPYEGQDPLAGPDLLEETTPETLRRFYEDWYRPDLMAIVAVGDFDAAAVETLIRERFAPISGPADPPDPPQLFTLPFAQPAYFVLQDPEYQESWSELNYPVPAEPADTIGARRRNLAMELAFNMLSTRLDEDVRRGEAGFFNASRAANPFVRAQMTTGLFANAEPARLADTTEALLTEMQRALVHGFEQGELGRAREVLRGFVGLQYEERSTKQDHQWASDYIEHFLGGEPIPAAGEWHDLNQRLLDEMTPEYVSAVFENVIASTEPFVIIVGPEAAAGEIPTEAELTEIVQQVGSADVAPRRDDTTTVDSLMAAPEPADVTVRGVLPPTQIPVLTLQNGARVAMLPTEIRQDVVVFGAWSPGGWSLYPTEDVAEAQLASRIVAQSGAGPADQIALERFLAGRVVSLTPHIDETSEGFFGEAQARDLEILLQLVHLQMKQPRLDETARDLVIDQIRPRAASPEIDPDLAVDYALTDARYRGDQRFAPFPPLDEIDGFDLARADTIFRERFGDASDFVFVFAGDFDQDTLEHLVRRYLGTLPSGASAEIWRDIRPGPPAGIEKETVEAGTGERGGVTFQFSSTLTLDPETRAEISVLERIVRQRLTDRIREQLSATYSPGTALRIQEEPVDGVEAFIAIGGDPSGLDQVSAEVLADLAGLRNGGPTADQLAIAQEQLTRDYELFSNESLVQTLLFHLGHPDEDFGDFLLRTDRVVAVTAADVREMAETVFPPDRYIEVRLVPVGFGE